MNPLLLLIIAICFYISSLLLLTILSWYLRRESREAERDRVGREIVDSVGRR